jgi:hypothetical protein
MPYSNIDKPNKYFVATPYTGDGANPRTVTTGLANDFVWIKSRTDGDDHRLVDSVRGASAFLESDSTLAEATTPANVLSFTSTGFTLSAGGAVNFNGETYASWAWVGGGTAVSNTAGSISSTVSANTTSGFSIVSYTGTGSNASIGHGLGSTPAMIICKSRSDAEEWATYHQSLTYTKYIVLNSSAAAVSTARFYQAPTSSLFYVDNGYGVNKSSATYVAYCFAEVKGFSKFGSYTGNGSTDGTFVYTGFKPAMVICKKTNASGTNWGIIDNKRANSFNVISAMLNPNSSGTEGANNNCDFVSNGFKWKSSDGNSNASSDTYIYMAFADSPFVSSKGIPTTAR